MHVTFLNVSSPCLLFSNHFLLLPNMLPIEITQRPSCFPNFPRLRHQFIILILEHLSEESKSVGAVFLLLAQCYVHLYLMSMAEQFSTANQFSKLPCPFLWGKTKVANHMPMRWGIVWAHRASSAAAKKYSCSELVINFSYQHNFRADKDIFNLW
jgi:hypothetical protein